MRHDLQYLIALTKVPLVGAVTAKNLISYCGGAEAVFRATKKQLLAIPNVGERLAQNILESDTLTEAEQELKKLERYEISAHYYLEQHYPQRLKNYHDCPLLLFTKGNVALNATRTVAIVGTRTPTHHGKEFCEQLVETLVPYQVQIISGLAYGIDITAHKKCVATQTPTIGVLGHGLQRIYPHAHKSIATQMTNNGGLLTEYAADVPPDREHFPMRNRIIAGMSDAVIVVETATEGGSIITANIANEYNKDVFAVPGRTSDVFSAGCNNLIKQNKAHLITSAADVAYIMQWELLDSTKNIQPKLFEPLSAEEERITNIIRQKQPIGIDAIAFEANKSQSQLASLLLQLEFKGIVKSLPGKLYAL
ncbi:MAG: DNA-processing protein DprA [Saprospiraceae bacterium]|nr:DNA-processing protein DprA [Saprospiraceae bacterium]MBP7699529.1 DNA-processing protein DprA [Saprospiraceae bacterium]